MECLFWKKRSLSLLLIDPNFIKKKIRDILGMICNSSSLSYGNTNLGFKGMAQFFLGYW